MGSEEFCRNAKATWLVSRGTYYGERKMFDDAIKDIEEALQLKSDHLPAHVARAFACAGKGDIRRAKQLVADMPDEMKLNGRVVARKTDMTALELLDQITG